MIFGLQSGGGLIELLEHQYDLSGVDVTLLEGLDGLSEVHLLGKVDPTCIDVELLDLGLEVRTLVRFLQEDDVGLFDSSGREEELDLVLRRNLHKLMHLRLHDILPRRVVLCYHVDVVALEVDTGLTEFELLVRLNSLLKLVSCCRIVYSCRVFIGNDHIHLLHHDLLNNTRWVHTELDLLVNTLHLEILSEVILHKGKTLGL